MTLFRCHEMLWFRDVSLWFFQLLGCWCVLCSSGRVAASVGSARCAYRRGSRVGRWCRKSYQSSLHPHLLWCLEAIFSSPFCGFFHNYFWFLDMPFALHHRKSGFVSPFWWESVLCTTVIREGISQFGKDDNAFVRRSGSSDFRY